MHGLGAAPLSYFIFVVWLLRSAVGFTWHAGLPRAGCFSKRSVQHDASCGKAPRATSCWRGRRHNVRGPAGTAGLCAALQVEPVQRLENGCVLVAGPENYGHMTLKAVALVYEHAEGQATRAVCLDKGLAFTLGEMVFSDADIGPLANNRLFRGGDEGGSVAIMIHTHSIAGARPLGDTGLFVGGFAAALDLVDRRGAEPEDFKFFFNHLAWPDGALEQQIEKGLWKLVKLTNDVVLDAKQMRDMELWGRVEFALKKSVEQ